MPGGVRNDVGPFRVVEGPADKKKTFFLREAVPDPNVVTHFASANIIGTLQLLVWR
jgi:hypothetical protein